MKGEYSQCLNCTCDCVTSGSLAYINARHMPLEKSWSREQGGGYWALATPITWWRRWLSPSISALIPQPLNLSADVPPQVHLHWGKSHSVFASNHLLTLYPLPHVPEATAVTAAPEGLNVAPTVCARRCRPVPSKNLNRKISPFFLFQNRAYS